MLVTYNISISLGRYNLTRWQHLVLGQWSMILSFCEFLRPVSARCPTIQIILTARRCLIYAECELSAPNRPCSFFSYHPAQHPPSCRNSVCFWAQPLNVITIVMNRTQRQKLLLLAAKWEPSPTCLIFFVGLSYSDFDKIAWQCGAVAQWHDSGCCGCCPLWPCHTISSVLPWWLGQRWTWGAEVTLSQVGGVCATLVWLQGTLLTGGVVDCHQTSPSFSALMASPDCAVKNKGWL